MRSRPDRQIPTRKPPRSWTTLWFLGFAVAWTAIVGA
jgi:hypothetical protein